MLLNRKIPTWLQNPIAIYVASGALACLSVTIRVSLKAIFEEQSRFFLLLPITLLCAVYGGVGPGLFAALLGGLLTVYFLVRPEGGPPGLGETKDVAGFVMYLLMCAGFLWLTHREIKERNRRLGVEARLAAANKQLEEANAELEAKVNERTAALKAASDELEGFCYTVAHDLRTPSRAIAGNARILLEDYSSKLDGNLSSHLHRMNNAAVKLGSLVDGLLIYARLAKQELIATDVNLEKLAREVIEGEARRGKIDLRLDIESDLYVRADERQMRILMRALGENSLLYRKPGQDAVISIRKRPGGGFIFEDEGIGFDMAYVEKVFQPFERLHRDETYPGVGLGLANVERVVSRHGGTVEIQSELGKGTVVTVELPMGTAPAKKQAVAARAS